MPLALALAAACLGGGVYAAGVLLSAPQAAEAMGESDVAALFEGDEAVAVNQTQSDAGYDVTLLGLATGEHLTDTWSSSAGPTATRKTAPPTRWWRCESPTAPPCRS